MRVFLLALLSACARALLDHTSLSLQVDPLKEECFFAEADAGQKVETTVLVYRGGKLDVYLRVEAPNGGDPLFNKLLFSNLAEDGRMLPTIVKKGFTFSAPAAGMYTICVDNRMAKYTAKVLTLDITVSDTVGGGGGGGGADVVKAPGPGAALDPDVLDSVLTTHDGLAPTAVQHVARVKRLAARLQSLEDRFLDDLRYHSLRMRRHFETLLSTERRVGWWSCGELVAIAVAVLFQVYTVFAWFPATVAGGPLVAAGAGGVPPLPFAVPPIPGFSGLSARKVEGSTSARGRV
jgi:hypothetical protein